MAYTTHAATTAPVKAYQTYPEKPFAHPSAIAKTTPAAAPWLSPRIPGSASGLRVTACRAAPASPSADPAVSPIAVRGTRSDRTTSASGESPPCRRASRTVDRGTGRVPTARLNATAVTVSRSATTSQAVRLAAVARRFTDLGGTACSA